MDDQTRKLMFSSVNPDYETPDDIFEKYRKEYDIKIDVCALEDNAKLPLFISFAQNIFKTIWKKTGFMNPPYNKPEKPCKKKCKKKKCPKRGYCITEYIPGQIDFVARVNEMVELEGTRTVCLLPARTDTEIFHKYIWDRKKGEKRKNVEVLDFLEGRIVFKGAKDPAPFPSMIVVFGPGN